MKATGQHATQHAKINSEQNDRQAIFLSLQEQLPADEQPTQLQVPTEPESSTIGGASIDQGRFEHIT